MSNRNWKIRTIRQIEFDGKWVEFWFEEETSKYGYEDYCESEKACNLSLCLEEDGILSDYEDDYDILTTACVGKKTRWVHDGYNWVLTEIYPDDYDWQDSSEDSNETDENSSGDSNEPNGRDSSAPEKGKEATM